MGSPSEVHESLGRVPDRAVRDQLNRILASEIFCRSERLSAFLRFVVDETLVGRGETLKEQVLAAELYGRRGVNPDDATVRTDARRLRDKLREYYSHFSREPVIIALPKGGYTPAFERNVSAPSIVLAAPDQQPQSSDAPGRKHSWTLTIWVGVSAAALLVCGAASWLSMTKAALPEDWRVIPVSSLPGPEKGPSISPDGNLIAFAWSGSDRPGPTDIYVKAVGSEAMLRLTDTPVSEGTPAWSPDGRQIAFVRDGQGVFVISQLGGSERHVSPSGGFPAWTPDSRSVLICDRVSNGTQGIVQVVLGTLERRQLTEPQPGQSDWKFNVSPDGKTLAFVRSVPPDDVHIVPMSSGEPQRRTNWNAAIGGVVWTPDGRDLIVNAGSGWPLSLWRIPAYGSRPERGSRIALPTSANSPSISRPEHGRPARLAFLKVYHDISLRVIDLDDQAQGQLISSVRPVCDSTLVDYPGSFSPDGRRIAFTSQRTSERAPGAVLDGNQLWVAAVDCSGLRQITALDSPVVRRPSWSPHGTHIAFEATIDGNTDIYTISAEGGALQRSTTDKAKDRFPCWSQHTPWIYFSSNRTGREEIWRVSTQGGSPEQVTRNGGSEPNESLDGKSLFYVDSTSGPSPRLKRIDLDSGNDTVVRERILPNHWAVTEKGLFLITREQSFDAVDLYRTADDSVRRVGRLPFRVAAIGDIGRFTVSRDGRLALTHEIERWDSDIMITDDFR